MKITNTSSACSKYYHLNWEYFELKLEQPLKSEIENHLKECESCREAFGQTEIMNQYLNFQKSLTTPSTLSLQILKKYHQKRRTETRLIYIFRPFAAAAILILMIAAGFFSGQFVAGRFWSNDATADVADPISFYANETFLPEADFITPGFEYLNE